MNQLLLAIKQGIIDDFMIATPPPGIATEIRVEKKIGDKRWSFCLSLSRRDLICMRDMAEIEQWVNREMEVFLHDVKRSIENDIR